MKIHFYTYCGEAGDLQELLVGVSPSGRKVYQLFTRVGFFHLFNLRRAKKKILKEFEILTGRKSEEKDDE